jgi:hypothetical protein
MSDYRNEINKELLREFLLCDEDLMGNAHLTEVYKVIDIVIHKYHSDVKSHISDLRAAAFALILERRQRFNPDLDAYNFIFTIARNEVGNNILRWRREFAIEDVMGVKEPCYNESISSDIPLACAKYVHYLTGEADFTVKRIARKDVADIICYLRCAENKQTAPLPEFLQNRQNSSEILYKLLKDLIQNE